MTTIKIYKKAAVYLSDIPEDLYHKHESLFDDMEGYEMDFDKLSNDVQLWLTGIDGNIITVEVVEFLDG